jgi:hypothetical protein
VRKLLTFAYASELRDEQGIAAQPDAAAPL